MNLRPTLAVLVALAVLPAAAVGQQEGGPPPEAGVCTADNPPARQKVEALLTEEDRADFRQRTGLADAALPDVEVLTDPGDTSICGRLQRLVPKDYRTQGEKKDWKITYFRVADRYVVTVLSDLEPDEPPEELAFGQTIVTDRDFEVVGTLMN